MTISEKATALLAGHRVQVIGAGERAIWARVRGDHGVYDVRWSRVEGWHCSCPNLRRCSHIEAVTLVTMRSVGRPLGEAVVGL